MEVRRPQVDKKDARKMGFSSLPLGGMGTANKSGNPPLPVLVEVRGALPCGGALRPLAGLSLGLSLSPSRYCFHRSY